MPAYDYKCERCGEIVEMVLTLAQLEKSDKFDIKHMSPNCDGIMNRIISKSQGISPDIEPFLDQNMGGEPVYVKSRRHQKEELKQRRLVQIG